MKTINIDANKVSPALINWYIVNKYSPSNEDLPVTVMFNSENREEDIEVWTSLLPYPHTEEQVVSAALCFGVDYVLLGAEEWWVKPS